MPNSTSLPRVLPHALDQLLGWIVSDTTDPSESRRRKGVAGLNLAILAWSPGYALLYATIFPAPYARLLLTCLGLGMGLIAASLLMIRKGRSLNLCVAMHGFALGGLLLLTASLTGGFRSPLVPWVVVLPLVGLGLGGGRMAWAFTGFVTAQLAALAGLKSFGIATPNLLSEMSGDILWGATIITVTLTIFLVGWIYESIKNQTISDLQRANEAKSEFLAHMSHEIRTPMTAILGFAQMLEEEKLSIDQVDHLRTIRRNGEHLLLVINDILDLARVEAGHLDLRLGAVNPATLVRDVATLVRPRAQERGLDFQVQVDSSLGKPILSDATRLQQVLINLAGNAIKFTERGHVRLSAMREGDGTIAFSVEDTGPGIPHEKLSLVFEPFVQVDASMSRKFGGTGLGLAISRRLVHALGGDLKVESEPGRGSTFTVRLPVTTVDEEPAQARPGNPGVSPLSGRVLLAEDSADSRRLLAHWLTRFGLELELAENGRVAIEKVRAAAARGAPIELVLMDMQMPELDGYGATRMLRAEGFRAPIIALTAHAMAGSRDTCLAAGCDDFLTKPVDVPTLRAAIASSLATRTS